QDEGRALIRNGRFNDARVKLQLAEQTLPGQKPVADALAEIRRREEDFRGLKAAAQAEFERKNYSSARDKLQQAQAADAELFAAENLGARLNEATTLASAARGTPPTGPVTPPAQPASPLSNAPGNAAADPKVVEGQRLVKSAVELIRQGKEAEADADYASAARTDPRNQDAAAAVAKAVKFKTLRDRGVEAGKSKSTAVTAQQALVDARNVDPDRFSREGLTAVLDRLTRSMNDDPVKVTLRQGLLALLNGRAQESIAILEPAASRDGGAAPVHAYLGVAYATQALSTPKPEDQTRLRDKAVEQFRLATAAEPGYQLSDRLVSPAVIQIYQSAR